MLTNMSATHCIKRPLDNNDSDRPRKRQKVENTNDANQIYIPEDIYFMIIPFCDEITLFMLRHVFAKNQSLDTKLTSELQSRLKTKTELCLVGNSRVEPIQVKFNNENPDDDDFGKEYGKLAYIYIKSAHLGYVNIMKYALDNKDQFLPTIKETHDDLHVRKNSWINCHFEAVHSAAEQGHLKCLKVATRRLPRKLRMKNPTVTQNATLGGNLECLRYAIKKGYGAVDLAYIAIKYDRLDCFNFAIDNDLWGSNTIKLLQADELWSENAHQKYRNIAIERDLYGQWSRRKPAQKLLQIKTLNF